MKFRFRLEINRSDGGRRAMIRAGRYYGLGSRVSEIHGQNLTKVVAVQTRKKRHVKDVEAELRECRGW